MPIFEYDESFKSDAGIHGLRSAENSVRRNALHVPLRSIYRHDVSHSRFDLDGSITRDQR